MWLITSITSLIASGCPLSNNVFVTTFSGSKPASLKTFTISTALSFYFVPFYFEVEYTDLDNCVNDKASNSYKYDDYEIIDSYYR